MRSANRAARIIAAIVKTRTKQLEYRLQASRYRGALSAERQYRAGEVDALLADLRAELHDQELRLTPQGAPAPHDAEAADR